MTAVATSRAERARQAELRELAAMMRERAGLPPAPVPPALHKMGAMATRPPSQTSARNSPSGGKRREPP